MRFKRPGEIYFSVKTVNPEQDADVTRALSKLKRAFLMVLLFSSVHLILISPVTMRASVAIAAAPVSLKSKRDVQISVDPRIELLSVVQVLSGYGLMNKDDTPYRRKVEAYFAPYKSHEAVKLFAEMYPKGFIFEVPPEAMLYLSNPPQLKQQIPFSEKIKQRAGGEQRLLQFVGALHDFARASKFISFYKENKKYYQQMTADVQRKVKEADYVSVMEDYYGIKQHSYNVMLMPLAQDLGLAANIRRDDGSFDVYGFIGRSNVRDGLPVFGGSENLSLTHLVWHEFGHSFVNPLTDKNRELVNTYVSLHAPISAQMKQKGYGTWEGTVNEHIIRAITSRFASREISNEAGAKELEGHKAQGFIYVEALYERLKEYETQRNKYRTFADFYPRLLEVFRDVIKE